MRILYYNHIVETGTLLVASENPNYPKENLQDPSKWLKYQSLAKAAQYISIYSPAAAAAYVFINNHNLTADATIKIVGDDVSFVDPDFMMDIPWAEGLMFLEFPKATYNYWMIYIDDPTNTDDFIYVGLAFIGDFVQMPGMEPAQTLPKNSDSKKTISISRQVWGDERPTYREFGVNFKFVTDAQRKAINDMWEYCKNITPFFLIPWEADTAFEPPIYCVSADKSLAWKRNDNYLYPWSIQMKFEEVF